MSTPTLDQVSREKIYFWNTAGTVCNALNTVLMLVVASKFLGTEMAGLFSLCYSTSQMLYNIASFELRSIQITDVRKEFYFSDYFCFRTITVFLMILTTAFFVYFNHFGADRTVLLVIFCFYMIVMSYSDLFQGCMQVHGRLDIAGKSLALNMIAGTICFGIALAISKNLYTASVWLCIEALIWLLLYDFKMSKPYIEKKKSFSLHKFKILLYFTAPLFFSIFLQSYIINAPKYAIDTFLSLREQAYFGYFLMPASAVNLLILICTRPAITPLAQIWNTRATAQMRTVLRKLLIWISTISIVVLAGGYIFGIPILSWLYSVNLHGMRQILMFMLVGGLFGSLSGFLCILITIIRRQTWCIVCCAITGLTALFLPAFLVRHLGLYGAAVSYMIEMGILFTAYAIVIIAAIIKKRNK